MSILNQFKEDLTTTFCIGTKCKIRFISVKNTTFKSSYNWFKIDIHQQLRPLTANYLAMFKVTSTTIHNIKPKLSAKRFHSQGMILNGFQKNHFSE